MAFEVKFWNFPKKVNSTARPSGEGTAFGCVLLSSSGIVDPVITLERGLSSVPDFNYCYIPSFNRYYFVREWTFSNSLWTASLSVDVLATYKDQIGANNFFVTRSSEEFDGAIVDSYYPVKNSYTSVDVKTFYSPTQSDNKIFPNAPSFGRYIVGLAGVPLEGIDNVGGVVYAVMNETVFSELLSELWGPDLNFYGGTSSTIGGIANELAKLIVDPYQYVVSAYWIPWIPQTISTRVDSWSVGFYNFVPTEPFNILDTTPDTLRINTITMELPKHPESTNRGSYLNNSPYAFYTLQLNGFGDFPIDGSKISESRFLVLNFYVDAVSGEGWLNICTRKEQGSDLIVIDKISLPLASRVMINTANKPQVVAETTGIVTSFAGSVATGNAVGAVSSIAQVPSIIQPSIRKTSVNGSIPTITSATATLNCIFYDVTEDDNEHHGRPLCQNKTVSALGGYIEVLDGDIALSGATEMESQSVTNYLEGGFFYE